jgi:uncharacterized caspase-like protein
MAKNWALVIGINEYNPLNFSRLHYARRDAEQVNAFFSQMGFDEVYLFTDNSPPITLPTGGTIPTDPTYGNLVTFLSDRFAQPFLTTGDNCWFFFAGHGERHGDKDYLMPRDANARGDKVISGLLVNDVREWLTRSGADNVILLLDACRSQGSRDARGINPADQKGIITISSCPPTERAWEIEELRQGAFTYALLEALQLGGEQSCATVERLGSYLKHRVPDLCQRYGKPPQIPRVSVDPIEKQHFILMPQFARQADIDLMKAEGFRLAFEGNLQLAEQLFIRANVAARGMDSKILDALTEVRIRMRGMTTQPIPSPPANNPGARSSAQTAETLSVRDIAEETISPEPAPTPSTNEIEIPLESEKGVDYQELQRLLAAGKWKEADQETAHRMLEAVGRKENDWIRDEELQTFPCKDLRTIDRLWVHYSKGKFGFSVQKKIWQNCGRPTDSGKNWDRFCVKVGWQTPDASAYVSYNNLRFNPEKSPEGQLPMSFEYLLWWWLSKVVWVEVLFSRAETCEL